MPNSPFKEYEKSLIQQKPELERNIGIIYMLKYKKNSNPIKRKKKFNKHS